MYPEINYVIPSEVSEKITDQAKISNQCLTLFIGPPIGVRDALWICHEELSKILEFQEKLTTSIKYSNNLSYDFVADYIKKGTSTHGIVTIDKERLNLSDLSHKLIMSVEFKDFELYASTLYLKEDFEFTGDASKKPNPERCFKLFQTNQVKNNNPDIFCIFVQRSDISLKLKLNNFQGRMAAEFYTNKINIRLQNIHVLKKTKELTALNPKQLEIDSRLLFPLKIQVRQDYFRVRRHYINLVRVEKLTKLDFASKLECLKKRIVGKICGGLDICKRALLFCIDKGHLSLRGKKERFAWDLMNPYHRLMPKMNLRINLPSENSKGKKILQLIAKMKKTNNYYAEKISESGAGETPNFYTIRKAYNTIRMMTDPNKEYKKFNELNSFCKADVKSATTNIKRKISFLSYAGTNDIFFEYLGFIRDFQFTKK